jgi:Tat protein secretion system quality control protein TatD with DNase activity
MPPLAPQVNAVVARARAAGVTTIIANGLNPQDNAAIKALATREPMVRPAYGFYPVDTVLTELTAMGNEYYRDSDPVTADEGVAWVEAHAGEAFAIGEIGLDGHWVPEPSVGETGSGLPPALRIALDAASRSSCTPAAVSGARSRSSRRWASSASIGTASAAR